MHAKGANPTGRFTISDAPRQGLRGGGHVQIRVGSGEEIDIDADRVVIGRDEACDIRLDDTKVSRRHAEIVRNGNGYEVRDLGSSNGTYLGSMRLTAPQGLKDGDVVRIGAHRLTVSQANGQVTELEPRGA